jgi:exonuclease SbcC
MKQIITEDAETRLNVLRHIFGIDKYKRIRENLAVFTNRLKEETKVLQGEVKTVEHDRSRLTAMQEQRLEIQKKLSDIQRLFHACVMQRKALESEISELEKNIRQKENFEKEVEKANILLTLKQEALASLVREQKELEASLAQAGQTYDEAQYTSTLASLEAARSKLDVLHQQSLTLLSSSASFEQAQAELLAKKERVFKIDLCPTCLQDVPEFHKHNILNDTETRLVALKKQLGVFREQHALLLQRISEQKSAITLHERRKLEWEILRTRREYLERSKNKLTEVAKQQETLQKDLGFLQQHLQHMKEQILVFSKFDTHYRLKQEELKKSFVAEKNAEINIAELNKESGMTLDECVRTQAQIAQKEALEAKLKNLTVVVDWLSNQFLALVDFTEIQVMMKLRREFSRVFSSWFHMIAGDAFEVQLDENFTPVIMQGEFEMEYSFLSGGERTAVALAYRLALNQTINSVLSQIKTKDIVILDEPTDGFSEAQIDKIRDVLDELSVGQLIIVSHEQKIEGFVDTIVRLRKAGDVSEIDATVQPLPTSTPRDG